MYFGVHGYHVSSYCHIALILTRGTIYCSHLRVGKAPGLLNQIQILIPYPARCIDQFNQILIPLTKINFPIFSLEHRYIDQIFTVSLTMCMLPTINIIIILLLLDNFQFLTARIGYENIFAYR